MGLHLTSEVCATKLTLSKFPIDYGFSHYTYILLKCWCAQSLALFLFALNHGGSTPYSGNW